MSLSRSHTLHRERYRTAQHWLRAADAWLQMRARIDELRMRELRNGDTERDDRLRAARDRLYAVRESQPLFNTYQEKGVIADLSGCARQADRVGDELNDVNDAITVDRQSDRDCFEGDPPTNLFPSGVSNIIQTPRRPGAPAIPAV